MSAADIPKPANLANYLALDHHVFVLCAGQASPRLVSDVVAFGDYADRPSSTFEPIADRFEPTLIRGHYLSVRVPVGLYDTHGQLYSYNYTPSRDVYPTQSLSASDVYCYPRSVGWLLGGSRQVGRLDKDGVWIGETTACDELGFNTYDDSPLVVPAPIFNLNNELLSVAGGPDLDRLKTATPTDITAGVGYRFVRSDLCENVRVGASRLIGSQEKIVVHNYGHGGAGYTLSWGCAVDVLATVDRIAHRAKPHSYLDHPAAAAISATTNRLRGLV